MLDHKANVKNAAYYFKHSYIDLLSLAVHVRNELRLKRCVENQQNIKIRIFTKKKKKEKKPNGVLTANMSVF